MWDDDYDNTAYNTDYSIQNILFSWLHLILDGLIWFFYDKMESQNVEYLFDVTTDTTFVREF